MVLILMILILYIYIYIYSIATTSSLWFFIIYNYSDWYRINPLEMVLLGCQTLADDTSACRDVSCSNCVFIIYYYNSMEPLL